MTRFLVGAPAGIAMVEVERLLPAACSDCGGTMIGRHDDPDDASVRWHVRVFGDALATVVWTPIELHVESADDAPIAVFADRLGELLRD